jgi:hypothetical protein
MLSALLVAIAVTCSVFNGLEWWAEQDSNLRLSACKTVTRRVFNGLAFPALSRFFCVSCARKSFAPSYLHGTKRARFERLMRRTRLMRYPPLLSGLLSGCCRVADFLARS